MRRAARAAFLHFAKPRPFSLGAVWLLLSSAALLTTPPALAQPIIYRCTHGYTDLPSSARLADCKPLDPKHSRLSVVKNGAASKPDAQEATNPVEASPKQPAPADTARQQLLRAQLQQAQTRQTQLRAEYNNGAPEKQGGEARNYQKYLDRVEALKTSLSQVQNEMDGLKRELNRHAKPGPPD